MEPDPDNPGFARRRILLLDTEPETRELLARSLAEAGADVHVATGERDAIAFLVETLPDLLLLEVGAPSLNGWRLLETIRRTGSTAELPVVLLSGGEDYASVDRARTLRAAAYVSKPFRLHEVIETCRRVMEGALPFLGRRPEAPALLPVRIEDASGRVLTAGWLLDRDAAGAQVDLETPLPVGLIVQLAQDTGSGKRIRAEVRWIRPAGLRFHHGLRTLGSG